MRVKQKLIIVSAILFLAQPCLFGQNSENTAIPVSNIFHDIGKNALHALTYNYGINFLTAGAGTLVLVESGFDWEYSRLFRANSTLACLGFPSLYIGYITPFVLPVALYLAGQHRVDERLRVTGMAVLQASLISIAYTSFFKGITGRISPGIVTVLDHTKSNKTEDFSSDFAWGFGRRGFIAGWPSAHTATAFSMAAVLSELYQDKTWVKIAAYSYAAVIGLGVSFCVHWSSEVLSGMLIGYAVGKTVGKSFNRLLQDTRPNPVRVSLQTTGNSIGVRVSW